MLEKLFTSRPAKSDDVFIEIISKQQAEKLFDRKAGMNADYFLRPGEDPYEKIKQNLFLKLVVDRTTCFAGEPILATFKLYSRLESKSDIVKNPGYYGFTVYDMVNLADKMMTTENVNGRIFDVHTIRKVQLYPLQEGRFIIDAMEVQNKVEFSRSIVNKKTEQQVVEGVLGNNDNDAATEDKEIVETSMSTAPVSINVKPVPVKNKPDGFSAAVGDFVISASLVNDSIAKNEEGILEISITGRGNFIQLNAPLVNWPAGIETFEPVIKDELDKTKIPLTGSRIFRYAFICNNPGFYQLPPVSFSFFDPRNNIYKSVSTTAKQVEVSNEEKKNIITAERKESIAGNNARASRVAAGIVILLVIIVLTCWILHKEKPAHAVRQEKTALPSIGEELATMGHLIKLSDKEFCTGLQQFIWKYLGNRLNLEGSGVNKEILFSKLKQEGVEDAIVTKLQKILTDCEMGIFTGAALGINKDKFLTEAKEVLEAINPSTSSVPLL